MTKLTRWIEKQNPSAAKAMSVVSGVDFYHISTATTLGTMVPRIGNRQMKTEDRTIPRICGAASLLGCIYGHSAVFDTTMNGQAFDGFDWVNDKHPVFYIYRLTVDEYVKPHKRLVPDAPVTGELWIVPYAPEAAAVRAERIGQLVLAVGQVTKRLGVEQLQSTFMLKVSKPLTLDKELLDIGFYQFTLSGELSINDNNRKMATVTDLKTISSAAWTAGLAEIEAVKKSKGK